MATQFWAINFAKNAAIYSVSVGFYQVLQGDDIDVSMVSISIVS